MYLNFLHKDGIKAAALQAATATSKQNKEFLGCRVSRVVATGEKQVGESEKG